jgi:hypothetical protein
LRSSATSAGRQARPADSRGSIGRPSTNAGAAALGVKRSIAYRLQAAKATAGAKDQQRVAEERRAYRDAARRLAVAIDRHRQAGAEEGIDPEPHDQALWDALGGVQVPHNGGKVAVGDLLADGVWH